MHARHAPTKETSSSCIDETSRALQIAVPYQPQLFVLGSKGCGASPPTNA